MIVNDTFSQLTQGTGERFNVKPGSAPPMVQSPPGGPPGQKGPPSPGAMEFMRELFAARSGNETLDQKELPKAAPKGGLEQELVSEGNALNSKDKNDLIEWLAAAQSVAEVAAPVLTPVLPVMAPAKNQTLAISKAEVIAPPVQQTSVPDNGTAFKNDGARATVKDSSALIPGVVNESVTSDTNNGLSIVRNGNAEDTTELRNALKTLNRTSIHTNEIDPRLVDRRNLEEVKVDTSLNNFSTGNTFKDLGASKNTASIKDIKSTQSLKGAASKQNLPLNVELSGSDLMSLRASLNNSEKNNNKESDLNTSQNAANESSVLDGFFARHSDSTKFDSTLTPAVSSSAVGGAKNINAAESTEVKGQWDMASVLRGLAVRGGGSVRMVLNPAGLGMVTVTVSEQKNNGIKNLNVNFETETQAGKDALGARADELKQALKNQDYQISSFNIDTSASKANAYVSKSVESIDSVQPADMSSSESWLNLHTLKLDGHNDHQIKLDSKSSNMSQEQSNKENQAWDSYQEWRDNGGRHKNKWDKYAELA